MCGKPLVFVYLQILKTVLNINNYCALRNYKDPTGWRAYTRLKHGLSGELFVRQTQVQTTLELI